MHSLLQLTAVVCAVTNDVMAIFGIQPWAYQLVQAEKAMKDYYEEV
jgi:hypothetical protein